MKRYLKQLYLYLIPLLLFEFTFRIQEIEAARFSFQMRSFLYALFLSLCLLTINLTKFKKISKTITLMVFIFIAFYFFIQTGIKDYYGTFFSSRFLIAGTPDVQSYAFDFIKFLKLKHFLYLLYGMLAIISYLKWVDTDLKFNFLSIISVLVVFGMYISSLVWMDPTFVFEKSMLLFKNPYYTELSIHQLGLQGFMISDLQYIAFPKRAFIEEEIIIETPEPKPEEKEPDLLFNRTFDDTPWITQMEAETDTTLKNIDQYLLNQSITPRNEKTGIYKDKHLILFLVEAFDMIAIDKDLTPTLFKLKTQGSYFNNFYSPQYNCATAESELMVLTGTYPVNSICTMNTYTKNATPQTIFNMFRKQNYETQSYHNWNDQFYARSVYQPLLGSQNYQDETTTIPRLIKGWQSDLTMMEKVVADLNQKEGQQMTFVITSTTHFPYDKDSYLGNKYLQEVSRVYPNAPMHIKRYLSKAIELDKSIEYLLNNYKDIDNTVLALFSDHRPLNMPLEYLKSYSEVDRSQFVGYEKTPFIVYTPNQNHETISTPSSTIDIAPTLGNLFDLEYDPRLFFGKDIYSSDENVVIFQGGSWIDSKGYFNVNTATFIPFNKEDTHTVEVIQTMNQKVKAKRNISSQIYQNGYYSKRAFLLEAHKSY